MKSGIYKIHNLLNNKIYIGKSVNIARRWIKHKKLLKEGKHFNTHLQSAFNKYSLSNFKIGIIELCNEEFLNEREEYWIGILKSRDNRYGYNKAPGGIGGCLNPESLAKMAASMKGKKMSEKAKQAISASLMGIPRPEEVRNKISKSKTGEIKSLEHNRKISATLKGRKLSLETKINMSKARKGKKQTIIVCPNCNKSGGTTMYRWHFGNCKEVI